MVRKGMMGRIS